MKSRDEERLRFHESPRLAVDGSPAWVDALVYVTVLVTVYSGADYFFGFRALLKARPASVRAASRR